VRCSTRLAPCLSSRASGDLVIELSCRVAPRNGPGLSNRQAPSRTEFRLSGKTATALQPLAVQHPEELDDRFDEAVRGQADAVIVFNRGFAVLNRLHIIEQAARQHLPTIYGWRQFVDEGGLMSYGPNVPVMVRKAASYVAGSVQPSAPRPAPGLRRTAATRTWRLGRPAADPAGSPTAPCAGGSPCSLV
jgi:hypothetical protein